MTTTQKKPRKNSLKNPPLEKNKCGRKSIYSTCVVEKICGLIASTAESLGEICKQNPGLPAEITIYKWLHKYPDFREKYVIAKKSQGYLFSEKIIDISNDTSNDYVTNGNGNLVVNHEHIQRSKLKIDTLKFLMEKHTPKVYGQKIQLDEINNAESDEYKRLLLAYRAKLDAEFRRDY